MTLQRVVPITEVVAANPVERIFGNRMAEVLKRQGQIEPLQVYRDPDAGVYRTYPQDPWGSEIVEAAKMLNWPNLLVIITDRWINV